nr:TetR-like C-terminal domain-containing protein [uncultured Blautia sp.]
MTNATKLALEESLKRLLLKKPLDKITINDLTTDCGISRMTFYYHFKDIYDLVEWSCLEDARIALQGKKTSSTWQEGLLQIFEAVTENKPFILNVYRCVGREQIENYLFHLTFDLLMGVVEEKSRGISISKEQKVFIADLYKYSFVGIMLDWIKNGMKEDYHVIVNDIATALYGSIDNAIQNFSKKPSSLTEKDLPGQNKNLSDPA